MGADGDLSSDNATAQNELWDEVGVTPASGSDSVKIAAALNARQTRNNYYGGYNDMSGAVIGDLRLRWEYDYNHSSPGIPNVDTTSS